MNFNVPNKRLKELICINLGFTHNEIKIYKKEKGIIYIECIVKKTGFACFIDINENDYSICLRFIPSNVETLLKKI